MRAGLIIPFLCVSLSAWAQGGSGVRDQVPTADLIVRVKTILGDPLTLPTMVQLSAIGGTPVTVPTRDGGRAIFNGLSLGSYTVVVDAPGYEAKTVEVRIDAPGPANVLVYLRVAGEEKSGRAPAGPPTLAPRAQSEIQKGLEALGENRLEEALAKFERASKMAPGNPYPYYLMGIVWGRKSDLDRARKEFETSVGLDPHNSVAQLALGSLLLRQKNWPGAIRALEEAIANGSGSSGTHWMLAWAYFKSRQYEKALSGTDKALSLANGKSPDLELLRAQALAALGREREAVTALKKFLADNPQHPKAETARKWLKQLDEVIYSTHASPHGSPPASSPALLPASPAAGPEAVPEAAPAPPSPAEAPAADWAPADIEKTTPSFEPGTACDEDAVIHGAEKRAEGLVDNLDRFAATEQVEIAEVDSAGVMRSEQRQEYDFMASVQNWKGNLILDENRQLYGKSADRDGRWLTSGLAELAFVFHPYYAKDFTLRCEGLTRWRGEPVWALHFEQRDDRPVRFRVYRLGKQSYPVKLKGRALIGANNHELMRIETDLAEPVEQIPLEREHLEIDYAPVLFKQRNTKLWLPQSAELFIHVKGRRYHFSHRLSGFTLFSVDTQERTADPKQP